MSFNNKHLDSLLILIIANCVLELAGIVNHRNLPIDLYSQEQIAIKQMITYYKRLGIKTSNVYSQKR